MGFSKIFSRIKRRYVFLFDGINSKKYMKKYNRWLKKQGCDISGFVKYISSTAYLDGGDFKLLHLGNNSVISRDVLILTHDFSIEAGLAAIGKGNNENESFVLKDVYIGENCFIGARTVILPGAVIGKNSIIGAGSVIPGKEYPPNSIICGNPGKVIMNVSDWIIQKQKYSEE